MKTPRPEPVPEQPALAKSRESARAPAATEPPRRPGRPAIPAALAAAGLLLVAAAVAAWTADRRERRDLLALHAAHSPPLPAGIAERLRGDPDLDRGRIALARGLVAYELEHARRDPQAAAEGAGLAEGLERLRLARTLAADVLRRRPASWQGAMLLGTGNYLARALADDPELIRSWQEWDYPLSLARDLAPGLDEPHRFSVLAYLELWPVLSEAKRELTRSLVRRALADWRTFGHIVELWIGIAETPAEVLAEAPDETYAWEHLAAVYVRRGDWPTAIQAIGRLDEVREAELAARLDQAAELGAGGFTERSRREFHDAVRLAPRPSRRFLPVLRRALAEAPPGPAGEAHAAAFRRWLGWTLELWAVGRCPLEPAEVGRLAGLAGELPEPLAAATLVLAGRLPEAERAERRSETAWTDDWGAYHLAKARELLRLGRPDEAEAALDRVPAGWRRRWLYLASRLDQAIAEGDPAAERAARAALAESRHRAWPAEEWSRRDGEAAIELVPGGAWATFEVGLEGASAAGAVVVAALDGVETGPLAAAPDRHLRLEPPAGAAGGAHWLTLRTLAGSAVPPGPVLALPAASGGRVASPTAGSAADAPASVN